MTELGIAFAGPPGPSLTAEQQEQLDTASTKADTAVQPGDDVSALSETSAAKIMTAAERTKLGGVAAGATANDTDANLKNRANHTGAQSISTVTGLQAALDGKATTAQGAKADTAVQPNADVSTLSETSTAKIMTGVERTKLAGVAAGATANDTDGNLKNRANHTGSQAISTVTGLQAALDGKATTAQGGKADSAVQPGDDISTLAETASEKIMTGAERAKLAGVSAGATANDTDGNLKNRSNHTGAQAISTVTGLQAALDGKAAAAQGAKADTAVQPGADVSVLSETSSAKIMTAAERAKLGSVAAGATVNDTDANLKNRANHTGAQPIASVTGLQIALDGKATSEQGAKADAAAAAVAPLADLVPRYDDRAGDARLLFSTATTGDPVARPPIAAGELVTDNEAGTVLRIKGVDTDDVSGYVDVAPRIAYPLYPAQAYRVTYRFRRHLNPTDPSNNAVELRWQNLNGNKASVSNVRLGPALEPVVADGIVTATFLIGKAGAPGTLDYTIPPTAIYGLPLIRIYGNGQETDAISILVDTVTDALGGQVELGQAVQDIAALQTGLQTLDGGLGTEVQRATGREDAIADDLASETLARNQQVASLDTRSTDLEARADETEGMIARVAVDDFLMLFKDLLGFVGGGITSDGGMLTRMLSLLGPLRVDADGTIITPRINLNNVDGSTDILRVQDMLGFLAARIKGDGGIETALLDIAGRISVAADGAIETGRLTFRADGDGFRVLDKMGWLLVNLAAEGSALPDFVTPSGFDSRLGNGGGSATTFTASDIAGYDGRALALSARRSAFVDSGYQGPRAKWNIFLVDGQSLGAGKEAAPTLTRVALMPNVYMFGGAERPADPGGTGTPNPTEWNSVGGVDAFNPLIAWTQNNTTGVLLNRTQEAAVAYPTGYNGEGPGIGAAYTYRRMWMDHLGVDDDPDHKIVLVNCSVGGQSLANLSPGASIELFNRVRQAFTKVKALAGSDSVALAGIIPVQGEADYDLGTPKATFKAGWVSLIAAIQAEATATFGQTQPAPVVTYQTAGDWTQNDLAIGQAWRELVAEQPHWSMVAPAYMYPNNPDGHLTGNGSRWMGCQIGKALFEASILGRKVRTVDAIEAVVRGNQALVMFDVPVPPISFASIWVGNTATDLPNKGLYASDGAGALNITAVDIVGQATLRLTFDRAASGPVTISGGRRTSAGGGLNICDSDQTVAPFAYEYHADYGQPAAENIPALVGKPYPLKNFAAAFTLIATAA